MSGQTETLDSTVGFDVEAARKDFPILSRKVHGKPLVFLDSAASAQKPRQVIEAVDYVYENEYANIHRGLYYLSEAATRRYETAREKVRRFINAGSGRGPCATGSGNPCGRPRRRIPL